MKKLIGIIMLGVCLVLTSCGGTQTAEVVNIVDDPSSEFKTLLGLESLTEPLKAIEDTSNYQEVLVSSNIEDSLFVHYVELDSLFESHSDRAVSLNLTCKTFVSGISGDYLSNLYSNLNDSTSGIKSKLTTSYDLMLNSWSTTLSLTNTYSNYLNGTKNNCLAAIYLPVNFRVMENSVVRLDVHVMVPLYYSLTTYDNNTFGDTTFNSYTKVFNNESLKIASNSTLLGSQQ